MSSKKLNENEYVPLISVVVPIYNIIEYIEKCIKSIIEQSYSNLEIILVDDGSTDGSSIICDEYSKIDSRIVVIHKRNEGVTSARKEGVSCAQGDYIICVDGDDWIEKNRIYNAVKQIENEKVDMLYLAGHYKDYKESSRLIQENVCEKSYYGNEIIDKFVHLLQNPEKCFERKIRSVLWSWVIKRELFQEKIKLLDNQITVSEDALCIWFCILSAYSLRICVENGYHYVQRYNSLSYTAREKKNLSLEILAKQLDICIENQKDKFADKVKACINVLYIMEIMLTDYSLLYKINNQFLFPYSQVKKGSKIVVYGAGKFGKQLLNAIYKKNDYEVVLWTDQSIDRCNVEGYTISATQRIKEVDFDYVVIAVAYEKDAMEIENKLIFLGVPRNKIARMNIEEIKKFKLNSLKAFVEKLQ